MRLPVFVSRQSSPKALCLGFISSASLAAAIYCVDTQVKVFGLEVGAEMFVIPPVLLSIFVTTQRAGSVSRYPTTALLWWLIPPLFLEITLVIVSGNARPLLYYLQFMLLASMGVAGAYLGSLRNPKQQSMVLATFVVAGIYLILSHVLQPLNVADRARDTISIANSVLNRDALNTFNSNALGATLGTAFLFVIAWLYASRRFKHGMIVALGTVAFAIVSYAVSKTFSRSAFLALSTAYVLFLLGEFSPRSMWRSLPVAIFVLVLSIYMLVSYGSGAYFNHFVDDRLIPSIANYGAQNPRIDTWADTIRRFLSGDTLSIVFGRGFFSVATDNSYINAVVCLGLAGSIWFLGGAAVFAITALRRTQGRRNMFVLLAALALVTIFAGFIDVFAYRKLLAPVFFLIGFMANSASTDVSPVAGSHVEHAG